MLCAYSRRARLVDDELHGDYLTDANIRWIRNTISSLLGDTNLSKYLSSRVVSRLKTPFPEWI